MWINNAEEVFSEMNLSHPGYMSFRTRYFVSKPDSDGDQGPTNEQIVSLDVRYAFGTNTGAGGGIEVSKMDLDGDWQLILRLNADQARMVVRQISIGLERWRKDQIAGSQEGGL